MGRTLHFSIAKEKGTFSRVEQQSMIDISNKFNSGKYKDVWTCENFHFTPFNYFPNWNDKFKNVPADKAWEEINKKWDLLAVKGMKQIYIYEQLYEQGYILFHQDPKSGYSDVIDHTIPV